MELKGKSVLHSAFGAGKITEFDGKLLHVQFGEEAPKRFAYPDAFTSFLKAENPAVQAKIDEDIAAVEKEERKRGQIEEIMRQLEEKKKKPTKKKAGR